MKLRELVGPVMTVAGAATGNPGLMAAGTAVSGYQQNKAQQDAAQRQMDFQAEMSSTSYQRQIADLKAAGINPMLVSRLGGASTPAGAMPILVNPAAAGAQAFSSAEQARAAAQQAQTQENLSESQIKNVQAMTDKIVEETKNIPIEGDRLRAMVFQIARMEDLLGQQAYTEQDKQKMLKETVRKLIAEEELIRFDINAAKALDNLGREATQLKPIVEIFRSIFRR